MNRVMWQALNGEAEEKHCGNCMLGTNGKKKCRGSQAIIFCLSAISEVYVISKCSGKGNWVPKEALMIKNK